MASGIFALFDDVAVLMDDVAVLSKIATKKTAGILGDDLAVNAEKAMGFVSSREIPVLLAITKGSFINKLIILPVAFFLSWLYPPAIIAILLFGGLYLAYEGAHKIASVFVPHKKETAIKSLEDKKPSPAEVLANEKAILKGAFEKSLLDKCTYEAQINDIINISVAKIYKSKEVIEKEVAGYKIIADLLDVFVSAVNNKFDGNSSNFDTLVLNLVPLEYQTESSNLYDRIMQICSYVSRMSDGYAIRLHRKLTGSLI